MDLGTSRFVYLALGAVAMALIGLGYLLNRRIAVAVGLGLLILLVALVVAGLLLPPTRLQ